MKHRVRKIIWKVIRWILPAAIIAWLVYDAMRNDSFAQLRDQPKRWDLLAIATGLCFLAVVNTMMRWRMLVRAIGIPLSVRDTLRLGFLGYLFNFVSPGAVGGDLFKAVFLARSCEGKKRKLR